ncbi:MAG: DEAD/DEAH box helicase [Candidatus Moranbacteria bacterium]|nr:DEAD/DEAH box helicase [Candidatus Moranbacteria bacterium]
MEQRKFKKKNFSSRGFSGRYRKPFYKRSRSKFKNRNRRQKKTIDIQRFIENIESSVSKEPMKIKNSFKDFNFNQSINQNLSLSGFKDPTPIQDQSIPHIIQGRDLLGLANTGTGKTAAFLLPLIDKCFRDRRQKVLVIAPTRELAQQIDQEFRKFSKNMRLYSAVCVGGMSTYKQLIELRKNPNFVIGTPGRLKDLKQRSKLSFSMFENVVLDEIDRMLDMGFVREISQILEQLPKKRQSLFFSATLPLKIEELTKKFLNNPIKIEVLTNKVPKNVEQNVIKTKKEEKFNCLKDVLIKEELSKVLIFSETKRDVEKLVKDLITKGFSADSIHGDKGQNQRQKALMRFKKNQVKILVATDVASRGLDINNISHVINYTTPQTYDDYIHRIGRTGRGDQKGVAFTFVY